MRAPPRTRARGPRAGLLSQLDVGLAVAGVRKLARVSGDRVWERRLGSMRARPPEPFVRLPLVYERVYGGTVRDDGGKIQACETANPVGVGLTAKVRAAALIGRALPNIEDPRQMMQAPTDRSRPVGFGAIAPSWQARACLAGTYDDAWRKTRAPYLPMDFDARFFDAAPPGFTFSRGACEEVNRSPYAGCLAKASWASPFLGATWG